MKISNILFLFILSVAIACSGNSSFDHGHSHDEEGEHSHDHEEGGHSHANEQEEFTVGADEKVEPEESEIVSRKDSVQIVVPAGKGVEYKFFLKQYEKLTYEWSSSAPLYSDFHGEPEDYEQTKYFESYVIATADKMEGMLTFPFAGSQGWYWKNTSQNDVTVTLKTEGKYNVLGLRK